MGSDISVVNAARVSFHKESTWEVVPSHMNYEDNQCHAKEQLKESDAKLINYLARHNHWTPFAHAFLSFRIKAPIFVSRQLVKHQVGLAWNEVSRRYVDDEPEYFLPSSWRSRPENGMKQGSGSKDVDPMWGQAAIEHMKGCHEWYMSSVAAGVAPEQARMVLPQNTMTEWIWSGSLAAFARVCNLRLDPHAQKETQEIAQQINACVPESFTHSWKALLNGA